MPIRINNLVLDIDEDISLLKGKAAKKLRIPEKDFKTFKILKESIDARKKNNIKFTYAVEISCDKEEKVLSRAKDKDIKLEQDSLREELVFGNKHMQHRPVVIGMGPAGMFAGLFLAQKGYRPLIIERGEKVEERTESVQHFWKTGELNLESNVQFGEGGAGTFSDGKLTTRIKDNRCDYVIEEMVRFGAPEEIAYVGKPHIGTDILKNVVKNIRKEIMSLGGEILFSSKMEDVIVKDNKLSSIIVNGNEIPCEVLVLAIGHSSRDTYEVLYKKGILMEAKPFAIGVRVEHSQGMINENQYGKYANHPRLKAADYRLTHTCENTGRSVYSFCMCPGGEVVAAASEEGRVVTNGMSYFKRDKDNANSALAVTVGPEDFMKDFSKFGTGHLSSKYPLLGMEFQRYYETLAYKVGGENYSAPIQLVGDFLNDKVSMKLGSIKPTYKPGYTFAMLNQCLPNYVVDSLKEGLINFDRKIKGFADYDAILTGIETRTSAPVRILRNETLQSVSVGGLYPAGEGAGFAGGIISAAVDGLKVAESIMREYKSLD